MTGSFTGDTNALTALTGTGSASMATSYLNGGNPAFLQLQDLTPGSLYTLSLHGIASSTPGVSDNLFSSGIDSLVVDQNAYGVDKGTVVTYTFIADGPTRNITISPQAASSWNLYGIALRQGSNSPINDISLSNNLIAENSVTNTSFLVMTTS